MQAEYKLFLEKIRLWTQIGAVTDADLIHNIVVITQVAQRRTPPGHTSHFIPYCPVYGG